VIGGYSSFRFLRLAVGADGHEKLPMSLDMWEEGYLP